MLHRMRSTWLAGAGAVLLVLSMSGLAAAATLVSDTSPEVSDPAEPLVSATISTFEDVNANGIDDDCETAVVAADAEIVTAALAAVDTNLDGTISVDEAAHSSWTGGVNCNHGGYVSGVAGSDETEDTETPAVCPVVPVVAPVEPVVVDPTVVVAANAHGKLVADVESDAVGGKNCNHGGAVSEAAHAAHADKLAKADHVKNVHATKTKTHGKHAPQN